MQTQAISDYPATARIYGLPYTLSYYRDKKLGPNTLATDTDNHILWVINPGDRRAVETAVRQAQMAFKGTIDDYVAQQHN